MKQLILMAVMAVTILGAKEPVAVPALEKAYSGATRDQMYGAMVTAVANYDIRLVVKEACLVKFYSRRTIPGDLTLWTLTCQQGSDGSVRVVLLPVYETKAGAQDFGKMGPHDRRHVVQVAMAFWQSMQEILVTRPETLAQKSGVR